MPGLSAEASTVLFISFVCISWTCVYVGGAGALHSLHTLASQVGKMGEHRFDTSLKDTERAGTGYRVLQSQLPKG